jgi:hypothetical protein
MGNYIKKLKEILAAWLFTPKCTCTRYEPEEDELKEKPH